MLYLLAYLAGVATSAAVILLVGVCMLAGDADETAWSAYSPDRLSRDP